MAESFWEFNTGPWLQPVLNCLPKFSRLLGTFSIGWYHSPVLNGAVQYRVVDAPGTKLSTATFSTGLWHQLVLNCPVQYQAVAPTGTKRPQHAGKFWEAVQYRLQPWPGTKLPKRFCLFQFCNSRFCLFQFCNSSKYVLCAIKFNKRLKNRYMYYFHHAKLYYYF